MPMPLHLCPPNGTPGDNSKCVLTQTLPASSRLAIFLALSTSLLQTDAPRPVSVLLTLLITSSSPLHLRTGMMGPNGSSTTMRLSSGGLSMMVGGRKYPLPLDAESGGPPRATFHPCFGISEYRS